MDAIADSSTRFVLGEQSAYVRNLAALWAVDPALAATLERLESTPSYPVEPSRSGEPTIRLTAGGRSVYLHSRHQPIAEARRLIDSVNLQQHTAFYVQGFGLGYHLRELFTRVSDEALILVFEPDALLIRTALEHIDYSDMLLQGRIHFFLEADKPRMLQRLNEFVAVMSLGFEAVIHAPSLQLQPDFHRQIQQWLGEFAAYCRTSVTTLVANGRKTAENVARGLAWYVASPSITRLKGRAAGRPAIIVSAGPSLRKNQHLLAEAAKGAIIIAVQTTLRPLLADGVTPHFVTCLDYHEVSTRFYENLPAGLKTELVAEPKANSRILGMYPGPLSLVGNEFADGLLRELKLPRYGLRAGATVAHLAFYLAEHLGCDPILFVGQDLGFSDGLCYTPGTSYDDVWRPELSAFCTVEMKQWEHIARDKRILRRVPDVHGRPMYTEERLFSYLQQFERDFAACRSRVFDCTEGGALKRGAPPMPLREAMDRFCRGPLPAWPSDHPGLDFSRLGEAAKALWARVDEATQIETISRETLPVLREIAENLGDAARVNRAVAKIDGIRGRMNAMAETYQLVMEVSQLSELKRFRSDRSVRASGVTGVELQRLQVQRDLDNVSSVIDACREFRKLIGETADGLQTAARAHPAMRTPPAAPVSNAENRPEAA